MNPGCSPSRIFSDHLEDQGSNFFAHRLSTSRRSGSRKPFPIQPKPSTMPRDDCSGSNEDERLFPSSPNPSQHNPEALVRCSEPSARSFGVEREQLLTKGKIFKHEILTGTERTDYPAEEVPEPQDHGKNLIETSSNKLVAKSLILRMCSVLMTHNAVFSPGTLQTRDSRALPRRAALTGPG
jgi:hypothetical protein